jgi:hypothetical protein
MDIVQEYIVFERSYLNIPVDVSTCYWSNNIRRDASAGFNIYVSVFCSLKAQICYKNYIFMWEKSV